MRASQAIRAVFRWAARILGALLVGLALLLAVGEGVHPGDFDLRSGAMMLAFLTGLAGMLVLWRWELLGGGVVLAGMAVFYAIDYASSRDLPGGWVFPLCFAPGLLAWAAWAVGRNR